MAVVEAQAKVQLPQIIQILVLLVAQVVVELGVLTAQVVLVIRRQRLRLKEIMAELALHQEGSQPAVGEGHQRLVRMDQIILPQRVVQALLLRLPVPQ
jgi:hypothetical protein